MKTSEKTENISANNQPQPVHRILVVDDEPKILYLIFRIMEKTPHVLEAASDGKKALEALSRYSFDLMIVDLKMPCMDGETLMREVRETDERIAFIVLTGHGSLQTAYALLKDFHISDFIQKPLQSPEQLLFSVENALEKQRLEQQVQEHTAALEKHRFHLEELVEKRTTELININEKLRMEISEHKRTEEQLIRAKGAAEAANRAKSEFLANMSHELRTPLNHIIGFTELVVGKNFGELNEVQQEYLNEALDSSNHLLSLINDILDLTKVEAGNLELQMSDVNLKLLLENSLVMIKETAVKHGIRISTDLDGVPETIEADERKLKQIIYSLLSNAVKFTPDGGEIRLTADLVDSSLTVADNCKEKASDQKLNEITYALNSSHKVIRISVKDTGIGLKPEDLERIFNAFDQVDSSANRRFQGTGLGLSLTKSLVELHGGRIWAESEGEGKGSTFRFIIPFNS